MSDPRNAIEDADNAMRRDAYNHGVRDGKTLAAISTVKKWKEGKPKDFFGAAISDALDTLLEAAVPRA
jgi:hypothetical protein